MGAVTIDIKDMLSTAGVGTFAATLSSTWGIYISKEPMSPNQTITIYPTGGLAPNPKWLLDELSAQVRIRGDVNDYSALTRLVKELYVVIKGRGKVYTKYNGFEIMDI